MKTSTQRQFKAIKVWIVIACLALLVAYTLYQTARNHQFQFFGDLFYEANINAKVVALTFDDGPSRKGTDPVIRILREHNIKGTFYLNGRHIETKPELVTQLIDAGHEIGNHSYSHKRMVFMGYKQVANEVESTRALIRGVGYEGKIHFRPPYGKNLFILPYYLSKKGITTVTWDVEPETFNQGEDTPELIVKRTMANVKPGSVILLHVMYGDGSTLRALPEIITRLKSRGYDFATVSELIALSRENTTKD